MSRINAIRVVNLNYNNNGSHIDDMKFDMNGINTLLSWKNGGGKSVLTQLIMSLFVKNRLKRKGNGGRLFSDLFLPNSPTFISVEWALDGGAGYVLTGMMARKKQMYQKAWKWSISSVNIKMTAS